MPELSGTLGRKKAPGFGRLLRMAGQDYVPLSGVKKFKPGKSSAQIKVQILPGAHGNLKLKITSAAGYVATTPAQAKINLGQ